MEQLLVSTQACYGSQQPTITYRNVKVDVYSPDIAMSSADCTGSTPLVTEHFFLVISYQENSVHFWQLQPITATLFISPGNHCC